MKAAQLIDLHDVEEYWKSRNLIQSDQLTHYVRWLSRFLTGLGGDPGLSHEDVGAPRPASAWMPGATIWCGWWSDRSILHRQNRPCCA
jgi:hypothetical protein